MSEVENDLKLIAEGVTWLNLSNNNIADRELNFLKHMSNLAKLRLEKNRLSDRISYYLLDLKFLETINLNETTLPSRAFPDFKQICRSSEFIHGIQCVMLTNLSVDLKNILTFD